MSAVYASKCKTPAVLHFSKLIFNGATPLSLSPSAYASAAVTAVAAPGTESVGADLERLRFYGANEITFPFKI